MSTSTSPRKRARSGSSGETSTATSSSSRPRPAAPASASGEARPSGAAGRRAVRRRYDERSTDEDDEEREPSTVDNSSADESPVRRTIGSIAISARPSDPRSVKTAIQGRAVDDEDDEEPDTEPSGDEAAVAGPSRVGRRSASADPAAVLDLTDEGDDAGGAAGLSDSAAAALPLDRRQGESLFSTRLGDGPVTLGDGDEDDDVLVALPHSTVPAPSSSDRKGKRKASSPPPPAADALPSLSHLTCPICFGPPAPLALTSCGHAFCAPCLHAALVAGPALTPPPAGGAAGRGRGGAAARGRAALAAAGLRGRGGSRGGGRGGSAAARRGGASDSDDDGDPELNKHCPVCRTPLYGGWGKSLRGVVLRMAPVKR
ncbi:hypothetical protein Rhopal_005808-T1 [Rhodotorula paludigena]|uniref:RING-type domain-containing protein n=1 Tax=Rhodotorula paludigena TaxID=86838 RepID=A0AAV5GS85_9BASI|nr:hypothetical protein Rhopal_005808-T1 [Rhodotorula paludigena]